MKRILPRIGTTLLLSALLVGSISIVLTGKTTDDQSRRRDVFRRTDGVVAVELKKTPGQSEKLIFNWSQLAEGDVLASGEPVDGQCQTPKVMILIPKPAKGSERSYVLARDSNCQVVLEKRETKPAKPRGKRVSMTDGLAHSSNLLFRSPAMMRRVSSEFGSLYVSAYIWIDGDSPNGGIDGGMDYVYDPEWPGGLVYITGASSYCWDDFSVVDTQTCADPWSSIGFDEGPGSNVAYGATNFFDATYGSPPQQDAGSLETALTSDGFGNAWCGVGTSLSAGSVAGYIYGGGTCSN